MWLTHSIVDVVFTLAVIAGHTLLWVAFVNWTHAQPWKCSTLGKLRHLHDAAVIAFPVVLLWNLGWDGSWDAIFWDTERFPVVWRITAFACYLSFMLWSCSVVGRPTAPPRAVVDERSQVHDIAAEVSEPLGGDGPHQLMLRVPGNELFTLEVSHKRLALKNYPAGAAPLRILHLTDWHFIGTPARAYYDRVTEIIRELDFDLAVFTGDLIDRRSLSEWVGPTLGQIDAPLGRLFILGNHDWYAGEQHCREAMTAAGWTDVAGRTVSIEHDGLSLLIGGSERPWMGEEPEFSGEGLRIALCHTPDRIKYAKSQKADLMLPGHNHGGQVRLPLIGPLFSPSLYGTRYAAGTFEEDGLVLHVGRGLAGRHPLRLGARPEITVLTVTSAGGESSS